MFRSMTGFGRSTINVKRGNFNVEIQSVNRKYFESVVFLPKDYGSLEIELKKLIAQKVFRGQVTLRVYFNSLHSVDDLLPDIKNLQSLKKAWEKIAIKLQLDPKKIDLNFLVGQMKLTQKENSDFENEKKAILKCLDKALNDMISMKIKEGDELLKDIQGRLKSIEKSLDKIQKIGAVGLKNYEKKIREKLLVILKQNMSEERIVQETALYAEKVDITEEIVRLKSHIKQFFSNIKSEEIIGRKLDFLIQEMMREANTISSKSADKDLSALIVDIKSQLEKTREQIQNIE